MSFSIPIGRVQAAIQRLVLITFNVTAIKISGSLYMFSGCLKFYSAVGRILESDILFIEQIFDFIKRLSDTSIRPTAENTTWSGGSLPPNRSFFTIFKILRETKNAGWQPALQVLQRFQPETVNVGLESRPTP
ncbi:hypothetical protein ACKLNO_10505 [Neisseriaceae bacterium B1]